LLEEITFYPGNFSSTYGRKTGGILNVRVRDPRTDGWHGALETSAIDAWVLAEGPIGDKVSVALAARRSLIDLILPAVLSGTTLTVTAAPVYYDHQFILTYRPTERDRIRLMSYGASDAFAFIVGDDLAEDPNIREVVAHDEGEGVRSEEHTSELQSRENLVCRLLLEKKK